jgi:hypothetical protein
MPHKPGRPSAIPITPQEVEAVRKELLGFLRLLAAAVAQRLRKKSPPAIIATKATKRRGKGKPRQR